jgi:hypothetical protein
MSTLGATAVAAADNPDAKNIAAEGEGLDVPLLLQDDRCV